MQQKNLLLFVVLTVLILFSWAKLSQHLWPPPPPKPENTEVVNNDDKDKPKSGDAKKSADKEKANGKKAVREKAGRQEAGAHRLAPICNSCTPTDEAKLVPLGAQERDSKFHLFVQIDPRGAAVHSLWLNKYQAADEHGRPEWTNAEKTAPRPLELVPGDRYRYAPSFQTFAFDVNDPNGDQPLDTLARLNWTVVERKTDDMDGRRRESVSFQAETQGVIVTKTYTLTEGEYHLGLAVKMRRKEGADKSISFRYQMAGAHGLPVEGKYYTSIFRSAMIARVDKDGGVSRDLQDLRQIGQWGGGSEFLRMAGNALIYAAVANQYFVSAIVVDNQQKSRDFLRQARPTLETTLSKGTVVRCAEDGASFVLKLSEREPDKTFYMRPGDLARFAKGKRLAVLHHTASCSEKNGEYPEIVNGIFGEDEQPPALWMDDITVRVSTEPVELKDDAEVVHKYLLYHGPVKVSQLFPPPGLPSKALEKGGVQPELLDRYHDELHLNTLTDYHSPGAMGNFANAIYWSALVIKCTNLMHAVLGYIHALISNYGLCIIVLTVLVRGMMFPLSRKQALMSVRMQQLAPELKRLQERYKDDRQALGMAQMDLYRRHGVNPLGSCWVLLLQMPIFMGLYFALQESTHFRLAEFWPTWITNLAAPDMLFSWGENIPFISRIEDYGSFLYLGPYFNILPVIAVVLMIAQQKMMTPPPADEQQAMQQKMMKYMMIFFGLMFYKVAAGLCLYFIASSAWGFCERKLLPKKKVDGGEPPPASEGYFQRLLRQTRGEQVTIVPATGVTTRNGGILASPTEARGRSAGKRGRNRRRQTPANGDGEADNDSVLGRWRKRLREWWLAVLKEAEKKNRG